MDNNHDMREASDWGELQQLWQNSPPVDTDKMARKARFVWWRMRVNFAIELLMCGAGFVVALYLLYQAHTLATYVFAFAAWLLSTGGLYAAFRIRRGAWGRPGDTAQSLVALQIRRARSAILYVKANYWLGIVSFAMLPLAWWMVVDEDPNITADELLRVKYIIGGGLAALVMVMLALWPYMKKKQSELEELQNIARQLDEDEAD